MILFNKRLFAAVLLMAFSGVLTQCATPPEQEGLELSHLLNRAISSERYISADEVAQMIIGNDPSFILVDVRNEEDFNAYAIPGAVHIPLAQLLDEEHKIHLDQDKRDVIFYSNDHLFADQAWVLCCREGYSHMKVLEGGLNAWYTDIINPTVPDESMPAEAFELYTTRKASSMYFGVKYPETFLKEPVVKIPVVKKPAPVEVVPKKKKKKRPMEGGC
ncbi:rhodanese-like domain-containing protein [Robertkochia sediminum]|uniref:rhodanese-like domain-containing protein n=1 Tax=Robertkochia sediminum TaxID=2785326 RepID=UPI001934B357|nr:rhodanese-like domain-containing protein [Robertkochia sediminum]MBL7471553.1 rhodanese-like domain-containing protein [Robertkochia sediminum]